MLLSTIFGITNYTLNWLWHVCKYVCPSWWLCVIKRVLLKRCKTIHVNLTVCAMNLPDITFAPLPHTLQNFPWKMRERKDYFANIFFCFAFHCELISNAILKEDAEFTVWFVLSFIHFTSVKNMLDSKHGSNSGCYWWKMYNQSKFDFICRLEYCYSITVTFVTIISKILEEEMGIIYKIMN